jgi:cyclopropane fatty-acyl-phospholipid synthase-like methyltransferase
VDVVPIVDTYHHIGDRAVYFRKLQPSLKPGGRVAIHRLQARFAWGSTERVPLFTAED